jgi:hypothetical protein
MAAASGHLCLTGPGIGGWLASAICAITRSYSVEEFRRRPLNTHVSKIHALTSGRAVHPTGPLPP